MNQAAGDEDLVRLGQRTLAELAERSPSHGIEGVLGDALFARVMHDVDANVDATRWLARAIDFSRASVLPLGLHRGLAGLGWLLATTGEYEDDLRAIDGKLLGALGLLPPASIQSGVAGIALYASLRSGVPSGEQLQRAALDMLLATAVRRGNGVVWHTPPWYARERGLDTRSQSISEYGVVHGIAGTLLALASLAREGHRAAHDLLCAALQAAWQHESASANRFGRISYGEEESLSSLEFETRRWCVGDPGVLRAVWVAAKAVGEEQSAARALARLREDAAIDGTPGRPWPGERGRFDLCCGISAIARIYGRMHEETRESVFLVAHERLAKACAARVARLQSPSFAYGRAGVISTLLNTFDGGGSWDVMLGMTIMNRVNRSGFIDRMTNCNGEASVS